MERYDRVILGAGIYGLYAASRSGSKKYRTLVIEIDDRPFQRASFINQARLHNGYHYPRSYSTAAKSAGYFDRFEKDFAAAIQREFKQIYAIAADFSWTGAGEFGMFCRNVGVKADEVNPEQYFKKGMIEGAFETKEYSFDAQKVADQLMAELELYPDVEFLWHDSVKEWDVDATSGEYRLVTHSGKTISAPFLLNATYCSVNQMLQFFGFPLFPIKYEICEMILCSPNDELKDVGLTVMDGPFFSLMPFGLTGKHSLTSVNFTPHISSHKDLPDFACQNKAKNCSVKQFANCRSCEFAPKTAWVEMDHLATKFILPKYQYTYQESLYAIKPILRASEIDDSRPTLVRKLRSTPDFYTVFSGKINTIYDMEEIL